MKNNKLKESMDIVLGFYKGELIEREVNNNEKLFIEQMIRIIEQDYDNLFEVESEE